jgi:pilus assembly protein CpaF
METMVLMAGMELPVRAIREQVASAVDLIVHQARFKDGSRRITHVTEILGMEGDVPITQDLFVYDIEGEDDNGKIIGRHRPTGIGHPRCWGRARYYGEEKNLAAALGVIETPSAFN